MHLRSAPGYPCSEAAVTSRRPRCAAWRYQALRGAGLCGEGLNGETGLVAAAGQ